MEQRTENESVILVVNKDVVKMIDEHRGEMNRTEFVNFLIHSQLRANLHTAGYVSSEEFYRVIGDMQALMRDLTRYVCTLAIGKQVKKGEFKGLFQRVESIRDHLKTKHLGSSED
ncbi:hypothetical protein ACFLWN_04285 [Chloroflexota bacterium]